MMNGTAPRLRSAGSPLVVQSLGSVLAAAFVLAASPSAFACHLSTHTERCVTGYNPSSVQLGAAANVDIVGLRLGDNLHGAGWQVSYGTGAGAVGRVTVRSWTPRSIQVQLPAGLAADTYWLALYNRDGQRRSNQLRGLTVQPFTLSPGGGGLVVPGPVLPSHDVTVSLRVSVINGGDSVSDGDWFLRFAAGLPGRTAGQVDWPGRADSQNVDDGSAVGPLGPIRFRVRSDQGISASVLIVDCDGWPVERLSWEHPPCNGEEVFEVASPEDILGANLAFSPDQWQRGGTFTQRHSEEGIDVNLRFTIEASPAP